MFKQPLSQQNSTTVRAYTHKCHLGHVDSNFRFKWEQSGNGEGLNTENKDRCSRKVLRRYFKMATSHKNLTHVVIPANIYLD